MRPNAWGLHDTLGNVWEWVQDEWTPDLKSQPRDGLAKGSAKGTNLGRVLCGGSWYIITRFARAGDRNLVDWDLARGRSSWAGFRVARTLL